MSVWIVDTDNIYGRFMSTLESNVINLEKDEVILIKGYNELNSERINKLINNRKIAKLSIISKYFGKNSTDFIIVIEAMKHLTNGHTVIIVTEDKVLQEACLYAGKDLITGDLHITDMNDTLKKVKKNLKNKKPVKLIVNNDCCENKNDTIDVSNLVGDERIKKDIQSLLMIEKAIDLSKIYNYLNKKYKSNGVAFYANNKKSLREICKKIS